MSASIDDISAPPEQSGGRPSSGQLRAARALLGWSLVGAARAAGVSVSTLARVERDADAARGGDVAAVVSAYRLAGVGLQRGGVSFSESAGAAPREM